MNELTLLGLGTVGQGVVLACTDHEAGWRITRALVRDTNRARVHSLPPGTLTADAGQALSGEGPVIEVLGGEQPAAELIARALRAGRPVASANKAAIAAHGRELFAIARERGVGLGIEACVGGGVPMIAGLRHLAAGQRLTRLRGVVNGTTNAILGAMEGGQSFDAALAAAQAAGYAEPDPSADIEGLDGAAKLAILMAVAFGEAVTPGSIPRRPLSSVSVADLHWARARGARIKYLVTARRADGALVAAVEPVALASDDPLASPEGANNALRIEGELIGATTLIGPGAGAAPTAGALLGDVATITRGLANLDYPAPTATLAEVTEEAGTYAIRLPGAAEPATIARADWTRDGDDWVGMARDVTGSSLATPVAALSGTMARWTLPS